MTIEGCVEQVMRDKITGWVVDRKKTNRRLVVELCVAGRHQPIEFLTADHQNKPDIGASKFREWADTLGAGPV